MAAVPAGRLPRLGRVARGPGTPLALDVDLPDITHPAMLTPRASLALSAAAVRPPSLPDCLIEQALAGELTYGHTHVTCGCVQAVTALARAVRGAAPVPLLQAWCIKRIFFSLFRDFSI
jgi:hypothetical protein